MSMCADNKAQLVADTLQNRVNMRGHCGTRIEHSQIGLTNDVGVGTGAGHRAGVRRHDAPHPI